MKIKYFQRRLRNAAVFSLFCLLSFFPVSSNAHNDPASHSALKGLGDGFRALMSSDGYGRSVFTLYVDLKATITNEMLKSETVKLSTSLGTAFVVRSDGYLLTNDHVANVSDVKKNYVEKITALYAKLTPPQKVHVVFKETYTAVASNHVEFPASLVAASEAIDAAIFKFAKDPPPLRRSFILEAEKAGAFSPVAVPGSPLGISNVLVNGNIARDELYECGAGSQKYLLFISNINPGNSGGPLYNLETDKVNGMVTAYLTAKNGGNSTISCAVPASVLIPFLKKNLPPL